jgi:soluble lytic murein transglycosylase-like protein
MARTNVKCSVKLVLIVALAASYASAADLAQLKNGYEIRHEQREVIGPNTRLYLNADRSGGYVDISTDQIASFAHDDSLPWVRSVDQEAQAVTSLVSKAVDVPAAVDTASRTHFIDADLISSIIHAESSFNPRAVSPKGAQGLMQLMPGTASKLGVKDSFDAHANVDGGTRYIRELLLRYNDDLPKALAAYNAGPHRVDQYKGVPPYKETRLYVARVIREFNRKKQSAKASGKAATGDSKSASVSQTADTPRGKQRATGKVATAGTAALGSGT